MSEPHDVSDAPQARRLVFEFPLEAGEAWLERVRGVAAPHVLRLGQVERPDKHVLICEVEVGREEALVHALQEAWAAFRAASDEASE